MVVTINEEMNGGAKRSPLDLLVLPQPVDFFISLSIGCREERPASAASVASRLKAVVRLFFSVLQEKKALTAFFRMLGWMFVRRI